MTHTPPPVPPVDYGYGNPYDEPPQRPITVTRKRRIWPWITVAVVVAFCAIGTLTTLAIGADHAANTIVTLPNAEPTASASHKAGAGTISVMGAGDYTVGRDIKAGTYHLTTGQDGINCYWARVKAFDGDLASVISNGNVGPNQKAQITIKPTDHGLDLQGDCELSPSK